MLVKTLQTIKLANFQFKCEAIENKKLISLLFITTRKLFSYFLLVKMLQRRKLVNFQSDDEAIENEKIISLLFIRTRKLYSYFFCSWKNDFTISS